MHENRPNVVFGFLGTYSDLQAFQTLRVPRWQPTISLFEHEDFPVQIFHIMYPSHSPEVDIDRLLKEIQTGIAWLSPSTIIKTHVIDYVTPWDFKDVYGKLYNFCENFCFHPETEDYYFHITVGTHVQQICVYLLTESHRFPGKILQTYGLDPYRKNKRPGYVILDPNELPVVVREYKKREERSIITILKSGFESINKPYNDVIDDLCQAAKYSREPVLLLGETGTGKSVEARRINEVKNGIFHLGGPFVEVNCATIVRELAVATLFGYRKGDYSGANHDQAGILQQAAGGMLFLDEIGELSLDVQAMLLQAIETRRFKIFGIHEEIKTDFLLVCGTNRNLEREVRRGRFREDLLNRINFWTFTMPPLRRRRDDLPKLIDFFVEEWAGENGNVIITFKGEALKQWLDFAEAEDTPWPGNLRELNHAVRRMCYYAHSDGEIITAGIVDKEIEGLRRAWGTKTHTIPKLRKNQKTLIPPELLPYLRGADKTALEELLRICGRGGSLNEAGRRLFNIPASTREKNYSDLARKFLDRCTEKLPGYRFVLERGKGLVLREKNRAQ